MDLRKIINLNNLDKVTGGAILLLAIFTAVFSARVSIQQRDLSECQTEYNQAVAEAIEQRSTAASTERQAIDDLFIAILASQETGREVREILEEFVTTREEANEVREDNPLPESPDCG